jgi:hypothetical protein
LTCERLEAVLTGAGWDDTQSSASVPNSRLRSRGASVFVLVVLNLRPGQVRGSGLLGFMAVRSAAEALTSWR